jgi:hypothetical protein
MATVDQSYHSFTIAPLDQTNGYVQGLCEPSTSSLTRGLLVPSSPCIHSWPSDMRACRAREIDGWLCGSKLRSFTIAPLTKRMHYAGAMESF